MISITMRDSEKFYKTSQFVQLQSEWDEKLRQSGFVDIEDDYGMLRTPDSRTVSFKNREKIRDFFAEVGHFVSHNVDLPEREKRVLTLYAEGVYLVKIAEEIRMSLNTVKNIIYKYKRIIMGCRAD